MGRRKKEREEIEKHVRMRKTFGESIEQEASQQGISFNKVLDKWLEKGFKAKALKYKGFKEESMTKPWVCFECGGHFKRGRTAFFDPNTGATMCIECAIENELTTKAVVKLIIKELRLKRNIKALKLQEKEDAQEYLEKMLSRTEKLMTLGITEKIIEFFKRAKERREQWMRYHEQNYKVEGKSRTDAFEDFMRTDEEVKAFLAIMKLEYEKAMRERQKLLEEKVRRERKRKKERTYVS